MADKTLRQIADLLTWTWMIISLIMTVVTDVILYRLLWFGMTALFFGGLYLKLRISASKEIDDLIEEKKKLEGS